MVLVIESVENSRCTRTYGGRLSLFYLRLLPKNLKIQWTGRKVGAAALIGAATVVLLTRCGSSERAAHEALRDVLKDPDSVMFGDYTKIGSEYACLTYNAKNGFGGYGGDKVAFLIKVEGTWIYGSNDSPSHDLCVSVAERMNNDE